MLDVKSGNGLLALLVPKLRKPRRLPEVPYGSLRVTSSQFAAFLSGGESGGEEPTAAAQCRPLEGGSIPFTRRKGGG